MTNIEDVFPKQELRQLRKRAVKALKQIEKSIKEEPSKITVTGESGMSESTADEIVEWLFHRRQDDGNTGD